MDEIDYMGDLDYSTVAAIAGERADIGMTCSSTPTGARKISHVYRSEHGILPALSSEHG